MDAVRGVPGRSAVVFTSKEFEIDNEDPTEWYEVELQLQDDGRFHIVDSTHLSIPFREDPGLTLTNAPTCGLRFG